MNDIRRIRTVAACLVAGLLLLGGLWAFAADYERIEAIAQGQGTQLSQRQNITIIIYEFSTDEEHQALIGAFNAAGQKGLFNAVTKMKAKGRIAISGTLGYDINFIKEFKVPEGRKIRMVTDRLIRFGEAWGDTRSSEYDLSAFEITLGPDKDSSSGTLFPRIKLQLDKETKEVVLKAYENPFKLLNIIDYPAK